MKKAFTLIELIISIFLLSLAILFISQSLSNLNINKNIFIKNENYLYKENKIVNLLYYDILLSKKIDIKNSKDFAILYLNTQNTIYNIDYPYVIWFVSKKNNTLCRIESSINMKLPINYEDIYKINLLSLNQNCSYFHISNSYDKKKYLVFLKFKNNPIYFSIYKP